MPTVRANASTEMDVNGDKLRPPLKTDEARCLGRKALVRTGEIAYAPNLDRGHYMTAGTHPQEIKGGQSRSTAKLSRVTAPLRLRLTLANSRAFAESPL